MIRNRSPTLHTLLDLNPLQPRKLRQMLHSPIGYKLRVVPSVVMHTKWTEVYAEVKWGVRVGEPVL